MAFSTLGEAGRGFRGARRSRSILVVVVGGVQSDIVVAAEIEKAKATQKSLDDLFADSPAPAKPAAAPAPAGSGSGSGSGK